MSLYSYIWKRGELYLLEKKKARVTAIILCILNGIYIILRAVLQHHLMLIGNYWFNALDLAL